LEYKHHTNQVTMTWVQIESSKRSRDILFPTTIWKTFFLLHLLVNVGRVH